MRISEIETTNKKINSEFHNLNYENVLYQISHYGQDQHVLHNLHLFRTCHANLLIYIYSLCHICFWNHRLQTVALCYTDWNDNFCHELTNN
jgi:hypothetical protein